MAEPLEQATPPAVNTQATRKLPGKPFEKGNKLGVGNRGGGRRGAAGLEKLIRDTVEIGDDRNALVEIMFQHAMGWRCLIHPVLEDPTTKSGFVEEWEKVSVSDQRAAVVWLTDRGYGKAHEFVTLEIEEGDDGRVDPYTIGSALRVRLDELAEKRKQRLLAEQQSEAEAAAN